MLHCRDVNMIDSGGSTVGAEGKYVLYDKCTISRIGSILDGSNTFRHTCGPRDLRELTDFGPITILITLNDLGNRDFVLQDGSREADHESVTACGCPYSAEPPVRILYPQDEVTLVAVSLECVVLMCELSREDAPVRWYKDGLEVEESEALVLESDGPHRRLVLPAAQPQDGGEFVCDAGDDSAFFTVTVTGGQSPRPPWRGREAGG